MIFFIMLQNIISSNKLVHLTRLANSLTISKTVN